MNRPYLLINAAASADGKIDHITRRGALLSSRKDKLRVDELRASMDAIMVGGKTLLGEDPKLTVRSGELRSRRIQEGLPENPAKVGILSEIPWIETDGSSGRGQKPHLSLLHNFLTAGSSQIYIFTTERTNPAILAYLVSAGVQTHVSPGRTIDLIYVLSSLYTSGIRSLMVEGGGTLNAELFRLGVVDELRVYIAPKIIGGTSAPTPVDGAGFFPEAAPALELVTVDRFDNQGGVLLQYKVIKNPDSKE
jgi:2,5-diamino-6-(ribosylamino)-4(3H)-pyrimidinone 5'-phosphate reductase